jgi:hypothetical protein
LETTGYSSQSMPKHAKAMNPMTCNSDGTKLSQFTQLTKNPDMLHCKNASKAMASFTSNPRLRNPELAVYNFLEEP